jgi:hypothetical protein
MITMIYWHFSDRIRSTPTAKKCSDDKGQIQLCPSHFQNVRNMAVTMPVLSEKFTWPLGTQFFPYRQTAKKNHDIEVCLRCVGLMAWPIFLIRGSKMLL